MSVLGMLECTAINFILIFCQIKVYASRPKGGMGSYKSVSHSQVTSSTVSQL